MKTLVSIAFLVSLLIAGPARAQDHGHHQTGLQADPPLSTSSLYNLELSWTDGEGRRVAMKDLKGQTRIVAMLYTACTTACPMLVAEIKSLSLKLPIEERKKLKMTIFSFDSERDKPESLKGFATKLKLDPESWTLLSSDSRSVAELAAALGVRYKKLNNGDYIHSNVVFLLNRNGEIVFSKEGLNGSNTEFLEKLKAELGTKQ